MTFLLVEQYFSIVTYILNYALLFSFHVFCCYYLLQLLLPCYVLSYYIIFYYIIINIIEYKYNLWIHNYQTIAVFQAIRKINIIPIVILTIILIIKLIKTIEKRIVIYPPSHLFNTLQ